MWDLIASRNARPINRFNPHSIIKLNVITQTIPLRNCNFNPHSIVRLNVAGQPVLLSQDPKFQSSFNCKIECELPHWISSSLDHIGFNPHPVAKLDVSTHATCRRLQEWLQFCFNPHSIVKLNVSSQAWNTDGPSNVSILIQLLDWMWAIECITLCLDIAVSILIQLLDWMWDRLSIHLCPCDKISILIQFLSWMQAVIQGSKDVKGVSILIQLLYWMWKVHALRYMIFLKVSILIQLLDWMWVMMLGELVTLSPVSILIQLLDWMWGHPSKGPAVMVCFNPHSIIRLNVSCHRLSIQHRRRCFNPHPIVRLDVRSNNKVKSNPYPVSILIQLLDWM